MDQSVFGAVVWAFGVKVLKISSLSSLLGLTSIIIATIFLNNGVGVDSNAPVYIIAFIIYYKHIPNVIRMIQGVEGKVA